ncbi:MAG: hypothetical protein HUU35_00895 [Armatimonadetes bacterium]|nr:hypothetical protein [Armatimonadota bacterium]
MWRIGGFNPAPEVALPVIAGALRHLTDSAPARPDAGRQPWLWHAVLTPAR